MGSWHTNLERKMIIAFGGTPMRKYGYDGEIRGRPVEVRAVRRDKRFRLQLDVHRKLVREGGSYIFCAPGERAKKITARKVSGILGPVPWVNDRKYPHLFLKKDQEF